MPSSSQPPAADARAGEASCRFLDWAAEVLADRDEAPALHHRLLIRELECLSRGEIDRLMVLMPPGSAKSTYASVLFPAWWFSQHPTSSIIAASHTADLAEHFGRQVRDLVLEYAERLGYELTPGTRAAGHWRTSRRGTYFAVGVRGPIAGRRADLAIIDDPVKSYAEADSATHRDLLWNWYRADLVPRLKPRGRIALIMTRWHEDDLVGRLLEHNPAEWRLLRLPALAESNDPLGRAEGAALWPEWEDEAALARKRETAGERVWQALFQQSPRPPGGQFFRINDIEVLDDPPAALGRTVRAWDLAATAKTDDNDPDWTAGIKLQRDPTGRFIVVDVNRLRGSPLTVQQAIARTAEVDGRGITIGLPADPGSGGQYTAAHLSAVLTGYRLSISREIGSKSTRATPVAAQVEARNLAILRAPWNHAFLNELKEFPNGSKDDQVDALSRAFAMLIETAAPARRLNVPLLAR